ncbi:FHA domain-containing protein [Streptomyces sp. NPDC048551]|uniref:FHA domain-containing protein n=1 Tax=Streptomyces sp. NPDC048551 TaxID=3155758 RepID=UPI00343F8844
MPTCPNGHQSASDDWCEVCGHRMAAAAPTGAPAAPSYGYGYPPTTGEPTAQAELCPQCRTPREAMAPFCEECRYNFLTRSATSSYAPIPGPDSGPGVGTGTGTGTGTGAGAPPPPPAPPQPVFSQDHFEYQGSRPSRVNRPAEPLQREDDWLLPPPSRDPQPPQPPQPQPVQQEYQQEYQQPHYQQQPPPQHEYQQPQPVQQPPMHEPFPPQAPPAPQTPQTPPTPPTPLTPQHGSASWSATIGPDRSYFMAMMQRSGPEAAALNLPAYSPEQHLPLSGGQITIGRRRASTGESPDVDLSVPPEDPGVSHQHAVLVQQPDGSWAVVDQNSTNGTTINGGEEPIQPYVPVPLADGDRVHVGAWTTITVRLG